VNQFNKTRQRKSSAFGLPQGFSFPALLIALTIFLIPIAQSAAAIAYRVKLAHANSAPLPEEEEKEKSEKEELREFSENEAKKSNDSDLDHFLPESEISLYQCWSRHLGVQESALTGKPSKLFLLYRQMKVNC